jgi:hypothetical protein
MEEEFAWTLYMLNSPTALDLSKSTADPDVAAFVELYKVTGAVDTERPNGRCGRDRPSLASDNRKREGRYGKSCDRWLFDISSRMVPCQSAHLALDLLRTAPAPLEATLGGSCSKVMLSVTLAPSAVATTRDMRATIGQPVERSTTASIVQRSLVTFASDLIATDRQSTEGRPPSLRRSRSIMTSRPFRRMASAIHGQRPAAVWRR